MKKLNDISLKNKLQMLLYLMIAGFVLIATIGFYNLQNMKKSVDSLYYGNILPSNNLNKILNLYDDKIELSIYRYLHSGNNAEETAKNLEEGLKAIHMYWNSYQTHEQSVDEQKYTDYVGNKIEDMNLQFLKILELLYEGNDLSLISITRLKKNMNELDSLIKKLITYEEQVAESNQKSLLLSFHATIVQIAMIVFVVVLFASYLASYIFKSIEYQQALQSLNAEKLKKLNKQLEESSYTDSLTSLSNRRYFNIVYDREFKRAMRLQHKIAFMMLDIDFFKQYNDTYGHLAGDETLKSVAKTLQTTLKRPTDYVFRLGGEEFGVLLTETNEEETKNIAKKINNNIENIKIEHEKNKASDYVTISIGVMLLTPSDVDEQESILSEADDKLYKAKESGRNRYVL